MSSQHVDPDKAVRIHLDVLATRSIGIHWGTFQLNDESLDQPQKALARAARPELDQSTATSSFIQASSVAPGASATRPCVAGSAMWIALLTWLTGSTQK